MLPSLKHRGVSKIQGFRDEHFERKITLTCTLTCLQPLVPISVLNCYKVKSLPLKILLGVSHPSLLLLPSLPGYTGVEEVYHP